MALQEDKYHKYIQDMHLMLKNYDTLVGSLTQVETRLLSRQLHHLQTVLNTGFTPLNWNSQRIPSFIETCNKALNEFSGIVSQIHKSSTMIREVVSRYPVSAREAHLTIVAFLQNALVTLLVVQVASLLRFRSPDCCFCWGRPKTCLLAIMSCRI